CARTHSVVIVAAPHFDYW
nr:immunoglobulin heavy chain junction region [Macaca mulatta]MOX92874.1 immunoglobulin heavy chain junction region [Macaca mulatta]MOX94240.1 immunoglobulin heavy chain junction region [Macaca mulatta]MOX95252.1 immunoglobulin heavy chain junction region [Macaca mulatta]MOX96071.1 immunoglobulin heavy chain junction region [Macaca mulatta]